jgi:hypothetical protein
MRNKIGEVRKVGLGEYADKKNPNNVSKHLNNSRSPMRAIVEKAYDYYPTAWVARSIEKGKLTPKKVERGYYADKWGEISISGLRERDQIETGIHELGHRFEKTIPNIIEQEKEFYNKRTNGEKSKWLGSGYSRNEITKSDKFIDAYMGKDYEGAFYELVSMGFQLAYADPTRLAKDPDMQEWILGLLLTL